MSKDLSKIHSRLLKTIQVNFTKPCKIEAIIDSVDPEKNCFFIQTEDGDKKLECFYKDDVTDLIKGDIVKIKGWVRLHPNLTGKIFLAVDYFYKLSYEDKFGPALDMHDRLTRTLVNEKCKSIIRKITSLPVPKFIYNIGLIVLPDDEKNIENFKTAFKEKCVGNIYIYRLLYKNIDSSLQTVFEYFKKYNNIDLICLLTNKLRLSDVCGLSSKDNVKYLLNRKSVPYTVSIIYRHVPEENFFVENSPSQKYAQPLSVMLSNNVFKGIDDCINFIRDSQLSTNKEIKDNIQLGKNMLEKIMEKQHQDLFEVRLCLTQMSDPKVIEITGKTDSPLEKLKFLLLRKLDKEKINLGYINAYIMRNIISYPQLGPIYQRIVDTEKRSLSYNSKVTTNDQKTAIDPPLANEKIENKKSDNDISDKPNTINNHDGDI